MTNQRNLPIADTYSETLHDICCADAFSEQPALKSLINAAVAAIEKACGFTLSSAEISQVEDFVYLELEHQVRHHMQPWFSEGIREEVKAMGYPVTVEAILDDAFLDTNIGELIKRYGPDKVIDYLPDHWKTDDCDFAGYQQKDLLACWKRLGFL